MLADETGAGFRETLLGETLRLARRRRQWRRTRQGVAAVAALALLCLGGSWLWQPAALHPVFDTACPVVRTQPLRPAEIVTTRPLASEQLVASVAAAPVVSTVLGGYREIGDDELLALAAPRVAALVRRGPHEADLIFVEPEPSAAPETN